MSRFHDTPALTTCPTAPSAQQVVVVSGGALRQQLVALHRWGKLAGRVGTPASPALGRGLFTHASSALPFFCPHKSWGWHAPPFLGRNAAPGLHTHRLQALLSSLVLSGG
jgi:hypothetical protein